MNNLVLSLAPKFTKLQTLVLRQDKPQLEDNAVETIASYCHDLQDLDLSKSFKLSDLSLYALAHGFPNLTKLNISGCTAFSDVSLECLTERCRKLKTLNLCGCVNGATDRALQVYACNYYIYIFFPSATEGVIWLTSLVNNLQAIGRNCSQLQSLNLGWCENVSDVGVMSLAYGCPDLRTLDLCGCVCITGIFKFGDDFASFHKMFLHYYLTKMYLLIVIRRKISLNYRMGKRLRNNAIPRILMA